jgi:hypothetical protein
MTFWIVFISFIVGVFFDRLCFFMRFYTLHQLTKKARDITEYYKLKLKELGIEYKDP